MFTTFGALVIILLVTLLTTFRILREYERGVVFLLGRFYKVKGPGLIVIIPGIQKMVRVDLRTVVMDVPSQDVISRDNVSVKVSAVVYFRVVDPQKSIIQVENFLAATSQFAQTTLRSVLGKHELEIKHVDIDESMIRAIARQAEAERERRAKVIHAEGELQASEKLTKAAQTLSQHAGAMQLRYLQTLTTIAGDKSNTIIFPIPMDLVSPLTEVFNKDHFKPS